MKGNMRDMLNANGKLNGGEDSDEEDLNKNVNNQSSNCGPCCEFN